MRVNQFSSISKGRVLSLSLNLGHIRMIKILLNVDVSGS